MFQHSTNISASKSSDRLYREATAELMKDDSGSVEKASELLQSAAALKGTGTVYEGIAKAKLRLFELNSDREVLRQARSAVEMAEKFDPTSRTEEVLHAQIDMADRAPELAISRLNRILSSKGPSSEVLRVLAKAQLLAGNSTEALANWKRAVELNPNFWLNHNGYGSALMTLGMPEKAEGEFRKVIELNSDSYVGYANLGAAYVAAGEFHRAIAVTEKSLTLRQTALQYNNLGTALYYTGSCHSAIELFRKAVELNTNSELYFGNLGEAYRCIGDNQNARAALGNALERARDALLKTPNNPRVEARLCVYLAKLGRTEEAERLLSPLLVKSAANPEVLYSQALVYLVGNEFSKAASAVRAALGAGRPIKVAAHDPELKLLWADPDLKRRFQAELDRESRAPSERDAW
jgi:serine/threonine-protein kinase